VGKLRAPLAEIGRDLQQSLKSGNSLQMPDFALPKASCSN
jgi:hypothetical protein